MPTLSFTIEESKKDRLDALASIQDMDTSHIINEALNAYLDLADWQIEHIKKGVRQADDGNFASEAEVDATFAKWKR
jgi:predicted transcriptional regulator